MEIVHPAEWELIRASTLDGPGGCTFADRRYERMKIQWRAMESRPNLRKLMEDRKRESKEDRVPEILRGQPTGWHGLVDRTGKGTIVHAGYFFDDTNVLLEVVLVWPKGRKRRIENRIFAHMRQHDPAAPVRLWRAMGIEMDLGREFDLRTYKAEVGRVAWQFARKQDKEPVLTVRRIGIPKYWLKTSLLDWLENERAAGARVESRKPDTVNGHSAARLISAERSPGARRLLGRRRIYTDLAWRCPVEERVYHVRYLEDTRGHEAPPQASLRVRCCRPYRHEVIEQGRT